MLGYVLKIKLKTLLPVLILFVFILLILYQLNFSQNHEQLNIPIILWWTPFLYEDNLREINCGEYKCLLTENRNYLNETNSFIYYGSNFNFYDLPLPRKPADLWFMIHEESPKNLAIFLHKDTQNLFNFTSTFSRFSDFPITLQHLPSLKLLTGKDYFLSTQDKNVLLKDIAPILYIQSDCTTPLERDSYVAELMKFIPIDSYGKCLNNKQLSKKFSNNPLDNLFETEFMHFVAKYKFVIAFENAICDDYITEKLWRPLITGSVPIYIGSPSIQDWLPNNNSAILALNYPNPQSLSVYLHQLNTNDTLYESYLALKLTETIENNRLKQSLIGRKWAIDNTEDQQHYFESFECFVCEQTYRTVKINTDRNVYDCPEPRSPLSRNKNDSNWWLNHWREGKCQGKVLQKLMYRNFTKNQFDLELNQMMLNNEC